MEGNIYFFSKTNLNQLCGSSHDLFTSFQTASKSNLQETKYYNLWGTDITLYKLSLEIKQKIID